ncbi:MAG: hypothetical protein JWO02_200, partial [Solirubrobacterales bacterium]|nr:hypothetical protein [Solirubrobacterales bacterium]
AVAYVDPLQVSSIQAALQRLLQDTDARAALGQAARARAATFSWDRFADVVLTAALAAAGRGRAGTKS